jgi:uncharacterized protein
MARHSKAKPNGFPTWADLAAPDAAVARDFYQKLFGWTYAVMGAEYGHYGMASIEGLPVAGVGQISPEMPMPPSWTVMMAVDDVAATVEKVIAHGGSIVSPAMEVEGQGHMAMCADPTGAVFGVWQALGNIGAQITDEHGSMTWSEANSRDAAKAADFYAGVFGLKVSKSELAGAEYYYLFAGDVRVSGVLQMTAEWGDMPAHWMTYFAVNDIDAAVAAANASGGQVPFPPFETPFGKIAVVMDPGGAAFSVLQR